MFTQLLESRRLAARQRASVFIAAAGLVPDGDQWHGELQVDECRRIPIRVSLPHCFPDELPVVKLDRTHLPRRVPHIERSGKICLAPTTGILLDTENPTGIVRDSLEIARRTLTEGLAGQRDDDFRKEFLAYWNPAETYIADCNPNGETREVELMLMERATLNVSLLPKMVLADTFEGGQNLIRMLGGTLRNRRKALFVSLEGSISAPDFDDVLAVRETMRIVRHVCSAGSWAALQKWFAQPVLPAIVLLSIPNCEGRILVAVQFEDVSSTARKKAAHGFRSGRVPAWRELQFAQQQPVKRIGAERYDAPFLLARGGAMDGLQEKIIALVGCGAVGSHVIERIASLGVGHFRLVDSESLESSNLYRHALGMSYIGKAKSEGMRDLICTRYLHIEAQTRAKDVMVVLRDEPDFILAADLIVLALGNETLELRLNELLGKQKARLHAWVEPLGIGGHILATGLGNSPGCFRCLFDRAEATGMANRAAFAKPGQMFQKSMAGCSGTFTPFAGIDADRTAIEVARLAARILAGKEARNQLVSWYGDPEEFEKTGFQLSKRARLFQPGECKSAKDIADPACPHCGDRQI